MRKRFVGRQTLLWIPLLAAAPNLGGAPVQAIHRLDAVVRDADTIAVAIVGRTRPVGDGMAATLQIVEALKGSLPGAVEAWYPAERVPNELEWLTGKTVVAFLGAPRRGGERRLLPMTNGAPPTHYLLTVPDTNLAAILPPAAADDNAIEKVIKVLARSADPASHSRAWIYVLSLAWARDVDPSVPPALLAVFQAMHGSSDRAIAERGLGGLLALGQIEGLRALRDALPQRRDESPVRAWTRGLAEYYHSESLEGVAILEGMISPANPVELRRAAGHTLGRIHSFAMLPVLARMLDDADVNLRSSAVQGFSAFAAGFRISGRQRKEGEWPFLTVEAMTWAVHDDALFRQRETEYVNFWRSWWARNRPLVMEVARLEQAR